MPSCYDVVINVYLCASIPQNCSNIQRAEQLIKKRIQEIRGSSSSNSDGSGASSGFDKTSGPFGGNGGFGGNGAGFGGNGAGFGDNNSSSKNHEITGLVRVCTGLNRLLCAFHGVFMRLLKSAFVSSSAEFDKK